jgi:hypothetical protein
MGEACPEGRSAAPQGLESPFPAPGRGPGGLPALP